VNERTDLPGDCGYAARLPGKTRPHLLEGVEAFGPRAEEDRRRVARLAFGVPDRQAVDLLSAGRVVLGECAGSAAQAGGTGPLHCLGAVVDLEFGKYVAYVVADRFG
jgi:hypothetical protein